MSERTATQNRWRNPIFLLVFVPGAGAWLTVVGWITWLYFNPIMGWVGGLHPALQEVLGTLVWVLWVIILVFGITGVGLLAERLAGIRPAAPTNGQTHGKHAGWTPPKRN